MLVRLRVPLSHHHVQERLSRRVANDDDGIPPGPKALADHECLGGSRVDRGGADSLQVRLNLVGVAPVMLSPVGLIEPKQVDHHDRLVFGDLRKLLRLLCGWYQAFGHSTLLSALSDSPPSPCRAAP